MVGIMDLNDEKDTLEDLERDKEIILEQLDKLKNKAEWIEDMMEEVTSTAARLKLKMDRLEDRAKQLRKKNIS